MGGLALGLPIIWCNLTKPASGRATTVCIKKPPFGINYGGLNIISREEFDSTEFC